MAISSKLFAKSLSEEYVIVLNDNTDLNKELKEENIKVVHYIMVAKPWHFYDCQLKEYFWNYAKKTWNIKFTEYAREKRRGA